MPKMLKMAVQMVVAVLAALTLLGQAADVQVPPTDGYTQATMFQPNDQVSDLLRWGVAMGVIGAKTKKLAKAIRGPRECWKDSQCPELRPYCLLKPSVGTAAETCVQCREDSECPEFQRPCSNVTNTCKPLVIPLVSMVLRYEGITVEGFTDADKAAVCTNLLALAGLTTQTGTCSITSVIPGSVIVIAEVRANGGSPSDFAIISSLTAALETATTQTLTLLASGISGSPTAEVQSVEEGTSSVDTSLPAPTPPSAPLNVNAQFPANGACVNSAKVTWVAPSSNGGATIATFVVACSSATSSVATTVSDSTLSVEIGPLVPGQTYLCGVGAINAAGAGPTAITTDSFLATYPVACAPGAPINPTTAPVDDEPFQRTVSWEAPASVGGGPILSYLITCTTDSFASGTRTLVVNAPVLTGVIGTLLEGSIYTCSVAATNEFGTGSATNAIPFGTELFVTSLGTKGWWAGGDAICSDFSLITCTTPNVQRKLRGLVYTFPNIDYIGQGTTGYTTGDDVVIAEFNSYFTNAYAGSTNGAVVLNGTNSNSGSSDVHYYKTLSDGTPQSIIPATFLLSADFQASFRVYYSKGASPAPNAQQTRTPGFVHNVFNPTDNATYSVIYLEPQCSDGQSCNQQWITSNIDRSSNFLIRKKTGSSPAPGWLCLDGTTNVACASQPNSLTAWGASPAGAVVFAPASYVWGVGSNLGSDQRNAFVAYDWLSTTALTLGARINFDVAIP